MEPTSNQEFSTSETAGAEHLASTPPVISNTDNVLPPRFDGRKNRSEVWKHFTAEPGSNKRAKCNYCGCFIKYNGTSSMNNHWKRCKGNMDKDGNKRHKSGSSSYASPSYPSFDQEAIRDALVKFLVAAELPFRLVEHEAFHKFMSVTQPKFNICSRTTAARDVLMPWDTERTSLKKFLSEHCGRVCLTTDTWTSCQNMCYMSLTAHFIDNTWVLHKKILNFRKVKDHSGETMAKTIVLCLNDWGLNRVFSLTVDNASSNDSGIQHLKRRLMFMNSLVLNGEYIHMRCCAHILNLIVKEGLKEIDDSILRIRGAVKYVKSSSTRFDRFNECVAMRKTEYNGSVCLDVETRWNSTYLMLEAALKLRKAFEELELSDKKYIRELQKGNGVPTDEDWDHASLLLPFLNIFYESTLNISGTSYVTSNLYMMEVFEIGMKIRQMCDSSDTSISLMAERMRMKYNKYWGNPDSLNMLLLIAVVLDPRCKMGFFDWSIGELFHCSEAIDLKVKLESCLKSIFDEYDTREKGSQGDSQEAQCDSKAKILSWYRNKSGRKSNVKSELNKYLEEDSEEEDLDILTWWRLNSNRFPILSNIAREVLAIPVSTVASESAFSTGGRVLDPYRSRLSAKMVEALVCTQDWLKGTPLSVLSNEELVEIEKIEQGMVSQQDVVCSTSITLDD